MQRKPNPPQLTLAGLFYRSRDEWVRYVIDRPKADLSVADRLVAIRIAMTLNPKDRSFVVSQETMAKRLDLSVQAVRNAVCKLKALGLIEVERVKLDKQKHAHNCYRLVRPEEAIRTERHTSG